MTCPPPPKEPLKNSTIHSLTGYCVSGRKKANAATDFGGADGVREVRAEVEAGAVSRRDGTDRAMGGVTGAGRTALSEGRERAASGRTEPHLRLYFVQQWFNLSDPGAEEALYESPVLRHFVGIDLGRAPVPDESTILGFRHRLEKHELGGAMLNAVNQYLESRGIRITTGTIVDASIIHAASSTKNRTGERDPEMHQTRKGKQWCVSRT